MGTVLLIILIGAQRCQTPLRPFQGGMGSDDLYVSDNYFSTECGMREGDYCRIVPTMIINLNEGADIKDIEREYKDVMTLRYTNDRNDSRFTTYHFDCHLNNSYEVLRLADELQKRNDTNWAEADKYSPIYFDNI